MANMMAKTRGNRTVQQNDISWSKRILGILGRTHINMKASIQTLIPKDTPEKIPSNIVAFSCLTAQSKGYKYPPKNSLDVSAQIRTILAYSAKKKKTKTTEECSVMKNINQYVFQCSSQLWSYGSPPVPLGLNEPSYSLNQLFYRNPRNLVSLCHAGDIDWNEEL